MSKIAAALNVATKTVSRDLSGLTDVKPPAERGGRPRKEPKPVVPKEKPRVPAERPSAFERATVSKPKPMSVPRPQPRRDWQLKVLTDEAMNWETACAITWETACLRLIDTRDDCVTPEKAEELFDAAEAYAPHFDRIRALLKARAGDGHSN